MVDLEQQVIPTLVVSHVSVLQMLIAYFRKSPVEEAMHIEVPLHTVMKFSPARGGGWNESHHELAPVFERVSSYEKLESVEESKEHNGNGLSKMMCPSPIWGDHMRKHRSKEILHKDKTLLEIP